MPITRAQLAKELEPGLNALFGLEYDRYDQEHAEIFDEETFSRITTANQYNHRTLAFIRLERYIFHVKFL